MIELRANSLTAPAEIASYGGFNLWICTAAGPGIGFGHIKRTCVLAAALKDCCQPLFLLHPNDHWSREFLKYHDWSYWSMEGDQIWSFVQDPTAVLIDTRLSEGVNDLIRSAQNRGIPVISIHDLGLQLLPSDIIIDGSIAPKQLGSSFRPTFYHSGTDYMILDPIYSWLHQEKKQIRNSIQSIYINLGGGDSARFYPPILEGLRLLEKEIEVVGVPGFISWGQEALTQKNWGRLRFRWESSDIERILFSADAAITAGGVSSYEALCAGTPLLCLSYDDFQRITITHIAVRGGCIDLGPGETLDPAVVAGLVSQLESDLERRKNMSRIGRSIVDGRGAERVSQLIRKAIADNPMANSLRQLNDAGSDF